MCDDSLTEMVVKEPKRLLKSNELACLGLEYPNEVFLAISAKVGL